MPVNQDKERVDALCEGLDSYKGPHDFPRGQPYYERNDPGRKMGIFIPRPGSVVDRCIAPGSGIVGSPAMGGKAVMLHYEGNLNGACNQHDWSERVVNAAGRHATAYPTIAFLCATGATLTDLVRVGTITGDWKIEVDPDCAEIVQRYVDTYPLAKSAQSSPRP